MKFICSVWIGLTFDGADICWIRDNFKWNFQVRFGYSTIFRHRANHFLITAYTFLVVIWWNYFLGFASCFQKEFSGFGRIYVE